MLEACAEWLTDCYLEWQKANKKNKAQKKTQTAFAKWLDIPKSNVSKWMSGKGLPGDDYIDLLAAKLGQEIYDVLNMPRKDPTLIFVIRNWSNVPTETQQEIRRTVAPFAKQENSESGSGGMGPTG